jgi:serine/threonine protein kinase
VGYETLSPHSRAYRPEVLEPGTKEVTLLGWMLLDAGQVIDGKYRITRLIGTGGMGAVYEGENVLIRRRIAIKVLHADSSTNAEVIRRFEREAQAAGEIGNDHILEVIDLGSLENGDRYMVMEYLDGETLAERIARYGHLTPHQVAPIARQFLTALISAHAAGIIHRDLKPENIFILRSKAGRTDFVKLIDFGISKFSRPFKEGEHRMTRANAVLGTPCYMSPEQARGASETDVRSDIYSCGVMLYEAVSGRLPFEGDSFNDLMFKIALSEPPPLLSVIPTLDPEFCAIIARAIARDPSARFESAQEFADSIDDWMIKNASTDGLSQARPSGSFSEKQRISAGLATMAAPDPFAATGFKKTGNEESWARSEADTTSKRRRGAIFAGSSLAGVAVVCIGIALVVRADPTPTTYRVGPGGPSASPIAPAPAASAPLSPTSLAAIPSASAMPDPSPSATAHRHDPGAKTVLGAHAQAQPAQQPTTRPAGDPAKPKPTTRPGGFDLGY